MPKKTGFKHDKHAFRNENSPFFKKWGEHAIDVAQREDVKIATIHMRVNNYGTYLQRTSKPSISEELCGKTMQMLSDELNLSRVAIQQRIFKYNNPYITKLGTIESDEKTHQPYKSRAEIWLAPEHPCYEEWVMDKAEADAKLRAEAEEMIKQLKKQREEKKKKQEAKYRRNQ